MLKNKLYYILKALYWLFVLCLVSSCDMLPEQQSAEREFALIVGDIFVSADELKQDREFFSKYMPAGVLKGYDETITQQIIYYYILLDYAEKNSIVFESDEDISAYMFGLSGTEKGIEQEFLHNGVNKHLWYKRAGNMLICLKVLEAMAEGAVSVSDEDVTAYVESNQDSFTEPVSATFQQAVFDNLNDAKKFLSDIKYGKYSDYSNKDFSGKDLPNFATVYNIPKENLPVALANAIFFKSPGEFGDIVKTEYGFHVFRVLNLSDGGPIDKNVAFNMAKRHLDNEAKINYIAKQFELLRSSTRIEINKKTIAKLENS